MYVLFLFMTIYNTYFDSWIRREVPLIEILLFYINLQIRNTSLKLPIDDD